MWLAFKSSDHPCTKFDGNQGNVEKAEGHDHPWSSQSFKQDVTTFNNQVCCFCLYTGHSFHFSIISSSTVNKIEHCLVTYWVEKTSESNVLATSIKQVCVCVWTCYSPNIWWSSWTKLTTRVSVSASLVFLAFSIPYIFEISLQL